MSSLYDAVVPNSDPDLRAREATEHTRVERAAAETRSVNRRAKVASAWKKAAWATVALVVIVAPMVSRELTEPTPAEMLETFMRLRREAKQFESLDAHPRRVQTAADARVVEQLAELRRQRAAMEAEQSLVGDSDAGVAATPVPAPTAPACLPGFHRYGDSVSCTPDTSRRR